MLSGFFDREEASRRSPDVGNGWVERQSLSHGHQVLEIVFHFALFRVRVNESYPPGEPFHSTHVEDWVAGSVHHHEQDLADDPGI